MRRVALSEIKEDFSRFLREAEGEEIVITRNGKPAGVLKGFASEDDWLDYRLAKTIRAFCAASSKRVSACARGETSELKMSSENREPLRVKTTVSGSYDTNSIFVVSAALS